MSLCGTRMKGQLAAYHIHVIPMYTYVFVRGINRMWGFVEEQKITEGQKEDIREKESFSNMNRKKKGKENNLKKEKTEIYVDGVKL